MASQAPQAAERTQQPFTLYAAGGRVLASNARQKLIDLGALTRQEDGFCYLLDGNKETGKGLPSAEAALREIASHLRFLYLDGQFTALADLRGSPDVSLDGAPRLDIVLDELRPGEPIVDATV
jgi:hypothetical protein